MHDLSRPDLRGLQESIKQLRGDIKRPPNTSIIIPVNAKEDLEAGLGILKDIVEYKGRYSIELILVINNYPKENPPKEITMFRKLGITVVAAASARRSGEVVIMSARALGVKAASASTTIHFDVDCKVWDINALVDWIIASMNSEVKVAYSHVGYYDLRKLPSVYCKIAIHNLVRWIKRNLFRVPTTRGSNYAVDRSLFLELYNAGKLSVDLQIGPAAKLAGARVVYSGQPKLRVFTSGRRFRGGWIKLLNYLRYRLNYNLNAVPTKRHEVTNTSWRGFDKETENRDSHMLTWSKQT